MSKTDEHISEARFAEIAFKDALQTDFEKSHIENCVGCLKALVDAMNDVIRKHKPKEQKLRTAGSSN